MKVKDFGKQFGEDQEDIVDDLDLSATRGVIQEQKRINVDFPGIPVLLLSVNVMWSADKILLWYFNEDFGIANQVRIKRDAPKAIRFIGLLFVCFVFYMGIQGLLEYVTT